MISRRKFIAASLCTLLFPALKLKSESKNNINIIKPKCLKPGDTISIIAPATNVSDPDDIYRAKEMLEYFGFKIKLGKNILKGSGYKTRTIE